MLSRALPAVLATAASAFAQAEPLVQEVLPVAIDSGLRANGSTSPNTVGVPQVVWSTVVTVPRAAWLRLHYGGVLLAGARDRGGDGSFLRITSLLDQHVQTQHLAHVGQWQDSSAYFNGDSVLVELLAHQGTGQNRLVIREVAHGPRDLPAPDSICGPTDDRQLSNDPRVARLMPIGCTGWLIDDCNHCLLTAGHCTGSSMQVVQFNVPLSTSSGSTVSPPPSDQYAVDPASVQTNGGQGVGNDWGYFGVFPNSTTGQTPFQRQGGQSFSLMTPPPVSAGLNIRITGNGSTSSPVSPTWYLVQKTHVGPYATFTGSTVRYVTDTTGGNSGSPVILENTGAAIGIHTHGGCSSTGGQNSGTGYNHTALQGALANPQGVCFCPNLTFTFPNGLPPAVDPAGTTTVRVLVGAAGATPQSGTGMLHWAVGSGAFQALPMTEVSPNVYDALFPAGSCLETVRYWFSARNTLNQVDREPRIGEFEGLVAQSLTMFRDYDFNTQPPGWSVQNTSVTAGGWARGTPAGGGARRDPPTDYDGSGQCWVTGLAANDDLDGGPTVLLTETMNLTALADPFLTYARWMSNDDLDDFLTVEISENAGGSWSQLERVGNTSGWVRVEFRLRNHVASLAQVRLRFSVADQPNNSVTEAAIDRFRIYDARCNQPSWTTFGTPCFGSGGLPLLVAVNDPALGSTFAVNVLNVGTGLPVMVLGLSNTVYSGGALPVPLQPFGFGAACQLLVSPDVTDVLGNTGGTANWSLALPNVPSLGGATFHVQAVVLDALPSVSFGGTAQVY